jgi:hypothetical protein
MKEGTSMASNKTAILALLSLTVLAGVVVSQKQSINIEEFMTEQELRDTGVAGLNPKQKEALNRWLIRYTKLVATTVRNSSTERPQNPLTPTPSSRCSPAVESTISGSFHGWSGDTIFKLDNGQIWQQAEYAFTYSYSYRPEVTIYETSAGCRLKVEDEEETILVRRIK